MNGHTCGAYGEKGQSVEPPAGHDVIGTRTPDAASGTAMNGNTFGRTPVLDIPRESTKAARSAVFFARKAMGYPTSRK